MDSTFRVPASLVLTTEPSGKLRCTDIYASSAGILIEAVYGLAQYAKYADCALIVAFSLTLIILLRFNETLH